MISLHMWNTDGHFLQYDFIDERHLVEFLMTIYCRYKHGEYGSLAIYEAHQSELEYIRASLDRDGVDETLTKWDARCDTDYLTIKNIRALLLHRNLRVYIENDFAYMHLSIHIPPRTTPP